MISPLDPTDRATAARVVEIQRVAYAVEAGLIGFDGIPQLIETVDDVAALSNLQWRAAHDDGQIAGVIAWEVDGDLIDIDRLAVDPAFARRGHGQRLVQSVPTDRHTIVSTGSDNTPAKNLYLRLGFHEIGRTEIASGIFTTQFSRESGS